MIPKEYTWEEIDWELCHSETPADIRRQIDLERVRTACKEHGITFTEAWLSPTGRIGLAQIIAAKVSGREATGLERDWLAALRGEDNG